MEGLGGKDGIAELCRKEGLAQTEVLSSPNTCVRSSEEFFNCGAAYLHGALTAAA